MPTTGIIFDLDGVLIDSADAHLESWRILARRHGREITEETFLETFGRCNADIIPMLFPDEATPDGLVRIADQKEAEYRNLVRGRLPIVDGAIELVRDCHKAGLRLAIGSSAPPENIALAIEGLGIAEMIAAVVSGDDVRRGKPDPEVFLSAAARLGADPAECVVIEDAPAGIEAALRAGIRVVAVATTHAANELGNATMVRAAVRELSAELLRGV